MDDRVKEILRYGITFAILIAFFFGGSYILKGYLGSEYPIMVVVSQSMVPTLGVGDFIFVTNVNPEQIHAAPAPNGDIIVFLRPFTNDEYIVHRAVEKQIKNGELTFVTKGDNNAVADGWRLPSSNVVGKVIGNIPLIGYFSIFIKTLWGFGFVVGLMMLSFLIDYVLPPKRPSLGRFPAWILVLVISGPVLIGLFWFIPRNHFLYEVLSIALWYVTCFILPLSFHDDDTGTMIWLYSVVLIMIPIACDVVWWTSGITPSMWWSTQSSAIQANWMLLKVTPMFELAFMKVIQMLGPGCLIFIITLFSKRRDLEPIKGWSRRVRGAPPEEPPLPEVYVESEPNEKIAEDHFPA